MLMFLENTPTQPTILEKENLHIHSPLDFLSGPRPLSCDCQDFWRLWDGRPEGSGPGHCALVMAERHHRLPSVHPRDPCLTDSPFCTHHPHPLLDPKEGVPATEVPFCIAWYSSKLKTFKHGCSSHILGHCSFRLSASFWFAIGRLLLLKFPIYQLRSCNW